MDWSLKGASWDFTELEEAGLPNIETVGGTINDGSSSSRFGVGSVNRSKEGEFFVDLKLGQVGNSGGGVSKTASSPSASGSSKRARAVNNTTQTVSCLVDGCNSDLSNCRDYHRRHKVCELHSKTPVVTIAGHKQRFCQQCSRFHSLEEFDEGKRSCRKRLDGHNRRRRKPQAVGLTRSANFLSNYQGRRVLPLSSSSSSQVYPSRSVGWDGRFQQQVQKQEVYLDLGSSSSATSSFVSNGNKQEMAPFLVACNLQNPCGGSVCQSSTATGMMRGTTTTTTTEESPPCALSLLSTPVVQSHSSSTPLSLVQPLGLNLHHHSFQHSLHTSLSSMYDIDSHASQGNHPPPSLPFHWE